MSGVTVNCLQARCLPSSESEGVELVNQRNLVSTGVNGASGERARQIPIGPLEE
jgi:hypothetical protein